MNDQQSKTILDKIEQGQVKMKPKSLILAQNGLQVVGTITLLLLTIYLVSYVLFQAKLSGAIHLTEFGANGVLDLLLSLPKIILVLTGLFFIMLIWSYEQFPTGYRRPLLFSVCGVILIVGTAGAIVYKTPLHAYFYEELHGQHNFHILGPLYRKPAQPHLRNSVYGQIVSIDQELFTISSPEGQTYLINFRKSPEDVEMNWPKETIDLKDWVIIRGKLDGHTINASAIKKVKTPTPKK